jgi:hypothetical protein
MQREREWVTVGAAAEIEIIDFWKEKEKQKKI